MKKYKENKITVFEIGPIQFQIDPFNPLFLFFAAIAFIVGISAIGAALFLYCMRKITQKRDYLPAPQEVPVPQSSGLREALRLLQRLETLGHLPSAEEEPEEVIEEVDVELVAEDDDVPLTSGNRHIFLAVHRLCQGSAPINVQDVPRSELSFNP